MGGPGADRFVLDDARWGYDEVFGFSPGQGDKLGMRGSGATELAQLIVQIIGGDTRILGRKRRYGTTRRRWVSAARPT